MTKAITICQPYAHLILTGEKKVENRPWPTKFRGPLYIHAGKSKKFLKESSKYDLDPEEFTFGAIIATANLVACIDVNLIESYYFNYPWLEDHEHVEGPWCFILENVKPIKKPMYLNGQLGLWNFVK